MNPINQIIAEGKGLCELAEQEEWIVGGVSGRMITTPSGYHGDGWIADVDTKPNAKHIAFHCPSQMKHLYSTLERAIEVIKFYSEGGHPNMDVWKHENLGYFTGKRAREFLASIEKRGEG